MTTNGCRFRFRHPGRPRVRCGLPVVASGEACLWHTDPKRRSSVGIGKALESVVQSEHWLEGARLDHLDLSGLDLTLANLPRADLHDASLERTQLTGAMLDGAHLNGAKLNRAGLVRASLRRAELNIAAKHNSSRPISRGRCSSAPSSTARTCTP
jgi:uncharacterized protein YjbI with pentapeptide repeats